MSFIPIQGSGVGILEGIVQLNFEQRSLITITNKILDDPVILKLFKINAPSGLTVADALTAFELGDVWATLRKTSGPGGITFGFLFSKDNQATWDQEFGVGTTSATFVEDLDQGPHNFDLGITHVAFAAFTAATTIGEIKEMKGKVFYSLPPGYSIEEISP